MLYVVALSYYHYLNFLGYSALPFLHHTEVGHKACSACGSSILRTLVLLKQVCKILAIVVAGVSLAHRRYSHGSCLCCFDKFQPDKIYIGVLFCVKLCSKASCGHSLWLLEVRNIVLNKTHGPGLT